MTVLIQTDKTTNYHQIITKTVFPKIKEVSPGKMKFGKIDEDDLYYYMLFKDKSDKLTYIVLVHQYYKKKLAKNFLRSLRKKFTS